MDPNEFFDLCRSVAPSASSGDCKEAFEGVDRPPPLGVMTPDEFNELMDKMSRRDEGRHGPGEHGERGGDEFNPFDHNPDDIFG